MQRRAKLKPEDLGVDDDATPGHKPRCTNCGVRIPTWRQAVCSYCKQDPCHGTDGFFVDILKDWIAEAAGHVVRFGTPHPAIPYWQDLVAKGEAHLVRCSGGRK